MVVVYRIHWIPKTGAPVCRPVHNTGRLCIVATALKLKGVRGGAASATVIP